MKRRTFLGKLLASPIVAAGAVEASNSSSGLAIYRAPLKGWGDPQESDPDFMRHDRLASSLHEALHRGSLDCRLRVDNLPSCITTKKSWSPAFKEHVFVQDQRHKDGVREEIHDALFKSPDPVTRGYRLMKIAKRLGVSA